jgi:hypothetical protein
VRRPTAPPEPDTAPKPADDSLVDEALSLASEGVPELPPLPDGVELPEAPKPASAGDGGVAADAQGNDAGAPVSAEEELRAALDLVSALVADARAAARVAARWTSLAPELDRRENDVRDAEARLRAQEEAARDNFKEQLDKELADEVLKVGAAHEAELARVRADLHLERERTRTLNDDLAAQLALAQQSEADAAKAKLEATNARQVSVFEAEAEVELVRRQDNARIRQLEDDLFDAQAERDAKAARIHQLEEDLAAHQLVRLQLAGRDPAELLNELAELQSLVTQSPAQQGLAVDERQELKQLRKANKDLAKDLLIARDQVLTAKEQAAANENRLAELSFQAASADAHKRLITQQRAELDELRARIGELRERDGSPFPRCQSIAAERDLQRPRRPGRSRDGLSLASIVPALQRQLAEDAEKPLRYQLDDLRIAFAGLHASRLHLLQGPSGTGKTSLPVALSKALGWGCSIIAVQDGWNDRQDLLGYFNTFDQQFQEKEFLQALYKAGTPAFADRPYLIVLDEANLSYVERYFTDFLSSLQLDPAEREPLQLAPPGLPGAPPRLEDGCLTIPTNVWFVGTANQDATTKEFAPKTIDRAHVLELVRNRHTHIAAGGEDILNGLGLDRLREWFKAATTEHDGVGQAALGRMEDALAAPLAKLELSLGNRLELYANSFLPALLAVGGTEALGMDHLLATKVLYPLRTRSVSSQQPLKELHESLKALWAALRYDASKSRASLLVENSRNRA